MRAAFEWRSSSRNNASARALSLGPPPAARPKGKKEQEIGPRSQARRQSLSTKNSFCTSIDFRRAHRQSAHKGLLVCQIVSGRGKVRTGGKVWLAEAKSSEGCLGYRHIRTRDARRAADAIHASVAI